MEVRRFGPVKRQVPVIGQGTWFLDQGDVPTAIAALRRGIDLGMTHIDTAEMYGDAEALVGRGHRGTAGRSVSGFQGPAQHASLLETVRACERSLARLRTDRLDCYLLHWRGPHPLEDTFMAFEQLKAAGKILSWGVSNFDVPDLEDAWTAGNGRLVVNQVLYHLQERAIEHYVLPWCEQQGLAVVAYSPLGHGQFPGPDTPGGRVLQEIAEAHGATPRQVALRFLVRHPLVFTIPKASKPRHAEENAGAGDLQLSQAEIDLIDRAFPLGPPPAQLPML